MSPYFLLVAIVTAFSMSALAQENRSRRFAPGVCRPVDPSYIRTAEETGGIPMFLLTTEIAQTARLMMIRSGSNHVTVFWAAGTLSEPREFVVPLDSVLQQVLFSFSVDTHASTMEVLSPAGGPITAAYAGAEVADLNCGRYITLSKPVPGAYRIRLRGSGKFWISVEGQSDADLDEARFVERGGRPGHEGYFPIAGQPVGGKPASLDARVSTGLKNPTLTLISAGNDEIRRLEMRTVDVNDRDTEFLSTFDLPPVPFRVRLTATDPNGYPCQRVVARLFRPSTVAIVPQDVAENDVSPGKIASFSYSVHNVGNPAHFRVLAITTRGFETRAEPSELTLPTGGSATVQVLVTIPADTPSGTSFHLSVSVSDVADPSVVNATARLLGVYSAPLK